MFVVTMVERHPRFGNFRNLFELPPEIITVEQAQQYVVDTWPLEKQIELALYDVTGTVEINLVACQEIQAKRALEQRHQNDIAVRRRLLNVALDRLCEIVPDADRQLYEDLRERFDPVKSMDAA